MTTTTARIVRGDMGAVTVAMEVHDCPTCGQLYAAPAVFFERRREDGASWNTICGHTAVYTESAADKLRKEKALLERQLTTLEEQRERYQGWLRDERQEHKSTQRSLSATKGQLTKTRKRVKAGVCPCCNRTFQQLARHMSGQHPDFVAENA